MTDAISKDVALQLCEEIRKKNLGKWYSPNGIWCTMCFRFSGGDVSLCFNNKPGYMGCSQVIALYERMESSEAN
jgi:hypothetical protein